MSIDVTDRRLIDVLRKNGRISNLELAEKVGLSPTPCSRRVKRLEDRGVIAGYAARINPVALGQTVTVMVSVRLSSPTKPEFDEFLAAVHRLPEITECLLVSGDVDYLLRVRTTDVEALRDFVLQELRAISCVSETSTMLILDSVKLID